jgi:hypothetical protein
MMLFQLHWQHRADFHKTEFVAQAEANSPDELEAMQRHFAAIVERRKDECPEEWGPMICTEESPYFCMGVADGNVP